MFNYLPISFAVPSKMGDRGTTVVKVLRYTSEVRWFDSRSVTGIIHRSNSSDRTVDLESTESLTETIKRIISWGEKRSVRKSDNLNTILGLSHLIREP